VKKIFLPSVLVLLFLVIGISNIEDADAHPLICSTGVLLGSEIYVVDQNGFLHIVEQTDAHSCVVGKMVTVTGVGASPVVFQDVAIDHSSAALPKTLFGTLSGTSLATISRIPVGCAFDGDIATCEVLVSGITAMTIGPPAPAGTFVGSPVSFVNALEIDGAGIAYAADIAGRVWNVNLVTAVLTVRTDYGVTFISSGDLVHDGSNPTDLYWTVQRCPTTAPENCASALNDGLYKITLTGAGPDPIVFVADLQSVNVFAADLTTSGNLCFINNAGFLFEFTRAGVKIGPTLGTDDINFAGIQRVLAFGGTSNLIGGVLLLIDHSALLLAGMEANSVWLILFMASGVAVVAYQFRSKNKN